MPQRATMVTAGACGAITVLALGAVEWLLAEVRPALTAWQQGALWLAALAIFFALPFYFFVIGREPIITRPWWVFDAAERSKFMPFARRAWVWLLSGWCVGIAVGAAYWLWWFLWPHP